MPMVALIKEELQVNPNKRNKYNKMYDKSSETVDPKDLNPISENQAETQPETCQGLRATASMVDETTFAPDIVTGVVVDCVKLRVRKLPTLHADVVRLINVNDKVLIDDEKSTNAFYKVTLETGEEGYCMKRFIKVTD